MSIVNKILTKSLLPLVTAAFVASGGCGGGTERNRDEGYQVAADTTITIASPTITKAQFVARVNALCRKALAKVIDNFAIYSKTQDPQLSDAEKFADAAQLSVLAGIDFHIFDSIRRLGAPRGQVRAIEEIIGSMQFAVESGQRQNPPKLHSVADMAKLFGDYNKRASQYGLDECLVTAAHLGQIQS